MMSFGYILLSFSESLVSGSYGDIIQAFTSQSTGHLQIHNKKFLEDENIYYSVSNYKKMYKKYKKIKGVKAIAPRITAGALAFANKKTAGVAVIGVDFEKENKLTGLNLRIKNQLSNKTELNAVLIGYKISKILKLKLGDSFAMIGSGVDGSIANDMFLVKGIMEKSSFDDMKIYAKLEKVQEFYSLYNQITHFSILLNDIGKTETKLKQLQFSHDSKYIIRPWQTIEADFFKAMEADRKGNVVSEFIIILIVSMGVLNTVLMTMLERTREFGLLKAIGTTPFQLAKMVTFEIIFTAMISLFLGFIFAYGINTYFSINGIQYSEPMSYGGMTFTELRGAMVPVAFYKPAIVILLSSLFVALIPSVKVINLKPIDGLRDF